MFEYVENEYNPNPRLVLQRCPTPPEKLTAHFPYSTSVTFPIPATHDEFVALHGRKYWQGVRRKERRLVEDVPDLRFRVVRDEDGLREVLPKVQQLFAERWASEFTSFAWKTPSGFEPYADAMVELARQGRGEVAVLEGGGRVLSFAYCLIEDDTYYFYQHASTPDAELRKRSLGKLFVSKLIQDLVLHRRCAVFDFMTGTSEYKREWARSEQQIFFRIEKDRTLSGRIAFAASWLAYRAKFYVQFENPRLRAVAKALLLWRDRLTRGAATVPPPDAAAQPALSTATTRTP
ncbi:GNAT family N-acetyltransferase [Actinomycetes bacterium KLBMP 9759]